MRVLLGSGWNIRQIVHSMGSTTQLYAKWARQMKLEVLTDEVGEGAKLHWIGPRRFDRVFLYAHGRHPIPVNLICPSELFTCHARNK